MKEILPIYTEPVIDKYKINVAFESLKKIKIFIF